MNTLEINPDVNPDINPDINDTNKGKPPVKFRSRSYFCPPSEIDKEFMDTLREGMHETLADATGKFENMQRKAREAGNILINS